MTVGDREENKHSLPKALLTSQKEGTVVPYEMRMLPLNLDKEATTKKFWTSIHDRKGIKTFGKRNLRLDFGTGKTYDQEFWIADITSPILGTDFYAKYIISLDFRNRLLIFQDKNETIEATTKQERTNNTEQLDPPNFWLAVQEQCL